MEMENEVERDIVVQKFGGSSLATEQGRLAAVDHVSKARASGLAVVVVVSAMGRSGDPYATDTLLGVVGNAADASSRDLDILMSCGEAISAVTFATLLRHRGHEVTVLSGSQAGIRTDSEHGDARILAIYPDRILSALKQGHVVVVMGFQGSAANGDVTTLGRGGSDTSATALGAALQAKVVDIFTDVDGIMTADPRIVPEAGRLGYASYSEVCHLAHHGAKVIHSTAVKMAMAAGVPIRVRNTRSQDPGTWIGDVTGLSIGGRRSYLTTESNKEWEAGGVTSTAETWYAEFNNASAAASALAQLEVQLGNSGFVAVRELSLVVTPASHNLRQIARLMQSFEGTAVKLRHCAKVAVIGCGKNLVAAENLRQIHLALQRQGIEVVFSGEEEEVLWCLVPQDSVIESVNTLHREFGLGESLRAVLTV